MAEILPSQFTYIKVSVSPVPSAKLFHCKKVCHSALITLSSVDSGPLFQLQPRASRNAGADQTGGSTGQQGNPLHISQEITFSYLGGHMEGSACYHFSLPSRVAVLYSSPGKQFNKLHLYLLLCLMQIAGLSYGFSLLVTQGRGLLFLEVMSSHQGATEKNKNWTVGIMRLLGAQMKDEHVWKGKGLDETLGLWLRLQAQAVESKDNHWTTWTRQGEDSNATGEGGDGACVEQGVGSERKSWHRSRVRSHESDNLQVPQKTTLPTLRTRTRTGKRGQSQTRAVMAC